MIKTKAIPKEDLYPILLAIKPPKLQVYAALLYWLACRAGELLPYTHYKVAYKKDSNDKLVRDANKNAIILSKEIDYTTPGIPISTVAVEPDFIEFTEVPVFKSRGIKYKNGFVRRKGNPMFDQIATYVIERRALQANANAIAEGSGKPPTTIYLFEKELEEESDLQFYWRFKKKLERFMNKKGYTVHSLRKTRATVAGNISGDAYYVQSITGHASIGMASEYVAKKKLFESMKKYEGF